MSAFIKITNPAENVDRRFLEKLGISTKRDDAETIGQFGSGAKLAPIAALRRGMRWVFVASDDNGPYTLEYVVRNIDGIDTVFYKYGDSEKESSFTIDAGVLSWDEDFQIFREAFSNAVDSKESYSIDVVDEIEDPQEGLVSVYISAIPPMMEIINDFDRWFAFNRTPLVTTSYGSIYRSSSDKYGLIFNKGVFVGEIENTYDENFSGKFFDWGFTNLELNEERRIKSAWSVEGAIKNVLVNVPDDEAGLLFAREVLLCEPFEITHFISGYMVPKIGNYTGVWRRAWHEEFGEDVIPVEHSTSAHVIQENLKVKGYRSRIVPEALANLLEGSGVKTAKAVLGERYEVPSIPCPEQHVALLDHAIRTVSRYDNRINKYNVSVMHDDNSDALGLSVLEHGKEEIFISTVCLDLGFKKVVSTLLHELDHVVSGVSDDQYRAFRDLADERLADLLSSSGYDVDVVIEENFINFPLHYVSTLGSLEYSIASSSFGSILGIGSTRFFIDAELQNSNGTMFVNSNNMLSINVNGIQEDTIMKKV